MFNLTFYSVKLILELPGPFGSCIKRWEMKKEIIQLHERFKQETIARPRLQNYSVYVSQRDSESVTVWENKRKHAFFL